MKKLCVISLLSLSVLAATAQTPATTDPERDAASALMGQALILRCLCSDNNLTYDAAGKLNVPTKNVDWTVSGFDLRKVTRKSSTALELDGVRVVARFDPYRREFDRKPQDIEPVHITMTTTGHLQAFRNTLHAAFAQGIDRELQLATPSYWQHYFDPAMKWPDDDLTGVTIRSIPNATPDATLATVTHRADTGYTIWAARGQVAGRVYLHLVVDAQGNPRHIVIATPLGYGLDEKAAEADEKYRFTPATSQGKPIASNVTLDEKFKFIPAPQ